MIVETSGVARRWIAIGAHLRPRYPHARMVMVVVMSGGKSRLPSPDLRFDTSDTVTPSAAPAKPRLAPRVVRIPPKAAAPDPLDASLASGSVVAVVPESAEAIYVNERRDRVESPPVVRAPRKLQRIRMPRLTKRLPR